MRIPSEGEEWEEHDTDCPAVYIRQMCCYSDMFCDKTLMEVLVLLCRKINIVLQLQKSCRI